MLSSTLKVCLKAKDLNQNERENEALAKRASYHLRQAVFTEQFSLAKKFYDLIKEVAKPGIQDRFFLLLANLQLPVYPFYQLYLKDH